MEDVQPCKRTWTAAAGLFVAGVVGHWTGASEGREGGTQRKGAGWKVPAGRNGASHFNAVNDIVFDPVRNRGEV